MAPLTHLSMEVKSMKEDVLHIRHDMQKMREGRVSIMEDELPPLIQDVLF